jgi:hypothetical protein
MGLARFVASTLKIRVMERDMTTVEITLPDQLAFVCDRVLEAGKWANLEAENVTVCAAAALMLLSQESPYGDDANKAGAAGAIGSLCEESMGNRRPTC